MDQSSEAGQCHEDYHFISSPEDRCSPLSPQADFLITNPDETLSLKSPPFVLSPAIHTKNSDLFGAPTNQQSKTGKHIILLYYINGALQIFSIPFMNLLPKVYIIKAVPKRKDLPWNYIFCLCVFHKNF
jgi:hypothetical protein